MKILCIADHKDPLVYSANIKNRFSDVSIILSAGDLRMEYLGFIASSLNKPLLFVFGNHHLQHYSLFKKTGDDTPVYEKNTFTPNYFGSTYIDSSVKKVKGLLIAGLGGSMRYNKGLNQFTDFGMFLKILHMIPGLLYNRIRYGRYLDILLTHSPPLGINDKPDKCHRGFKILLKFIEWFKPRYLIHGHIHLWDHNANRIAEYNNTKIINAYNHYVLEIEVDNV